MKGTWLLIVKTATLLNTRVIQLIWNATR